MNATELMMGFYVQLNKDYCFFEKGQIVKVLSITYYKYLTASARCQDANGYEFTIEVDYLDPIPLTVDILKDFGFKKTTSLVPRYILDDDLYTVFAKDIYDGAWLIDVLDNKFNLPDQSSIVYNVHQLQQWMRFCGIDREIKMSSLTSINTIKTYNHESK